MKFGIYMNMTIPWNPKYFMNSPVVSDLNLLSDHFIPLVSHVLRLLCLLQPHQSQSVRRHPLHSAGGPVAAHGQEHPHPCLHSLHGHQQGATHTGCIKSPSLFTEIRIMSLTRNRMQRLTEFSEPGTRAVVWLTGVYGTLTSIIENMRLTLSV